jgi:hypothetical protein
MEIQRLLTEQWFIFSEDTTTNISSCGIKRENLITNLKERSSVDLHQQSLVEGRWQESQDHKIWTLHHLGQNWHKCLSPRSTIVHEDIEPETL